MKAFTRFSTRRVDAAERQRGGKPHGISRFLVGGAGHGIQTFVKSDSRVAYQNDANPTASGAVFLALHSTNRALKHENARAAVHLRQLSLHSALRRATASPAHTSGMVDMLVADTRNSVSGLIVRLVDGQR